MSSLILTAKILAPHRLELAPKGWIDALTPTAAQTVIDN
jgi:hypothetical protein